MKTLRHAVIAFLAFTTAFCSAGAPAYAKAAQTPTPPKRPSAAEIARQLPPPPAPREPAMWYGPFDLRTASIA
jgi:hypothetical protein